MAFMQKDLLGGHNGGGANEISLQNVGGGISRPIPKMPNTDNKLSLLKKKNAVPLT